MIQKLWSFIKDDIGWLLMLSAGAVIVTLLVRLVWLTYNDGLPLFMP